MRAIIRISFNDDEGSRLRNPIEALLYRYEFRRSPSRTATYEVDRIDTQGVANALQELWQAVNDHAADGGPGRVDHFWMYIDQGPPQPAFRFGDPL